MSLALLYVVLVAQAGPLDNFANQPHEFGQVRRSIIGHT